MNFYFFFFSSVFVITLIGSATYIIKRSNNFAKLIELSPIEQLGLLGFSDLGPTNSLIYSHVIGAFKRSLVFEEKNNKVHFVNFDSVQNTVSTVGLNDVSSVDHDIKRKTVTIKTKMLEDPIIVLHVNNKEEMDRLLSGLDILLKNGDF